MTEVRVRGHWRTLPNGRRIWVHDYVRRDPHGKNEIMGADAARQIRAGHWGFHLRNGFGDDFTTEMHIVKRGPQDMTLEVRVWRNDEKLPAIADKVKIDNATYNRMLSEAEWGHRYTSEDFLKWLKLRDLGVIKSDTYKLMGAYLFARDDEKKYGMGDSMFQIEMGENGEKYIVADKQSLYFAPWRLEKTSLRDIREGDKVVNLTLDYQGRPSISSILTVEKIEEVNNDIIGLTFRYKSGFTTDMVFSLPVKREAFRDASRDFFQNNARNLYMFAYQRENLLIGFGINASDMTLLPYTPKMYARIDNIEPLSPEAQKLVKEINEGQAQRDFWVQDIFNNPNRSGYIQVIDFTKETMKTPEWAYDDVAAAIFPGATRRESDDYKALVAVEKKGVYEDEVSVDIAFKDIYRGGMAVNTYRLSTEVTMPMATWEKLRAGDRDAWEKLKKWTVLRYDIQEKREDIEKKFGDTYLYDPDEDTFDLDRFDEFYSSLNDLYEKLNDYKREKVKKQSGYYEVEEARDVFAPVIDALENDTFGKDDTTFSFVGVTWQAPGEATLHFMDDYGEGEFNFTVDLNDNSVYWDLMTIVSTKQGKGIGTELKYKAERALVDMGITTFTTLADITIGRYAWAVMGYDFAYVYAWRDRAELFLDMLEDEYGQDETMWAKIEKDPFIQRLRNGLEKHRSAKRYIHSWEFASWRAPDGKKFGKKFMLKHGSWDGVKTVDGPGWCIGCHYYKLKGWLEEGDTHCGRCKD